MCFNLPQKRVKRNRLQAQQTPKSSSHDRKGCRSLRLSLHRCLRFRHQIVLQIFCIWNCVRLCAVNVRLPFCAYKLKYENTFAVGRTRAEAEAEAKQDGECAAASIPMQACRARLLCHMCAVASAKGGMQFNAPTQYAQ